MPRRGKAPGAVNTALSPWTGVVALDDIEGAQGAFDSFGGLVSEHECLRADAAIDAAMNGANAKVSGRPHHETGKE